MNSHPPAPGAQHALNTAHVSAVSSSIAAPALKAGDRRCRVPELWLRPAVAPSELAPGLGEEEGSPRHRLGAAGLCQALESPAGGRGRDEYRTKQRHRHGSWFQ